MKILFFTDTHIRGNSPRSRLDNFYLTLKKKFIEVKDICEEENIDFLIHGGDWFDRPDISPSVVREFILILKEFNRKIYSVAGNHDMYGHNPDTIERTMLGIMDSMGLINIIRYHENVIIEKNDTKVMLKGSSYRYDIDGEDFSKYYIVKKEKDIDCLINIVHGMLLPKPFIHNIQHTILTDIYDTEADITLVGHYHSGFDTKFINEKYFVNPGSLLRVSNSKSEVNRIPQVVIINVNKEKIDIINRKLKVAKPGNEVLNVEKEYSIEDKYSKLKRFYKNLSEKDFYKKINIEEIIDEITKNREIEKKVKDEAINRIAKAEELIYGGEK